MFTSQNRQTILVTGGAGYIGGHFCKYVWQTGNYEPIVYDNFTRGHREFVKWGPFEEGDIRDEARLTEVLLTHRPCAVVHFAANCYVDESIYTPDVYYDNNVLGTLSLLKAMKAADVNRLIFSSSCATYGIPSMIPIPETASQHPIHPYGWTKFMSERMIQDWAKAYGLKAAILRYFNAAGSDPDGEIGESHQPETHLIPNVILAALLDKELNIYGSDYPTPDGTAIRDYIHVMDLASAHEKALQYLIRHEDAVTIANLGTGKGYSILEVINQCEQIMGCKIKKRFLARRVGDPPILIANPSLAQLKLNWMAEQSDLETLISTAKLWLEKASLFMAV